MHRIHLKIYGQVQGVFFRRSAQQQAQSLGLTGWVKNYADDCVEIVCEGETVAIKTMREWCAHGPEHARVFRIEEFVNEPIDGLSSFRIQY